MKPKDALLNIILERSFRYSEEPVFKLQSGKMSQYYIDLKQTTLFPQGLKIIGDEIYRMIRDEKVQAVGGLTLGADPIAIATSLAAYENGSPIHPFIVRKQAKGHGTGKRIEAAFPFPARVYVLDDVITTGESTIKAIQACLEEKLEVAGVICIVDREEGGKENILKEFNISVQALFTKSELLQRLHAK
jgi:orotate phosphoribosyltransferase